MAPVTLRCEVPGCQQEMLEAEPSVAIKFLEMHHTQVHSHARKTDKPKCPKLPMTGDAMEDTEFDRFAFMFEQYKQVAGIATNAPSHLLECLCPAIYHILYNTYGRALTDQSEKQLFTNIKRLVVR